MTKKFCDICGKPAMENLSLEIFRPMGEVLAGEKAGKRTCVRVTVNFGFRDHPTGFGGPPDICEGCVLDLIAAVKKEAERAKP